MRKAWMLMLTLCVMLVACADTTNAQEQGRLGLTMVYPEAVGMVWQASERVAVRPEVSFNQSASRTSGAQDDSWSWTAGASGLLYVHWWDSLRAYVSPRFSYGKGRSTFADTDTSSVGSLSFSSESTTSVYSASASLGAQYSLSRMFSLFAEAGPAYTRYSSSSTLTTSGAVSTFSAGSLSPSTYRSYTWRMRTVLGAILYF